MSSPVTGSIDRSPEFPIRFLFLVVLSGKPADDPRQNIHLNILTQASVSVAINSPTQAEYSQELQRKQHRDDNQKEARVFTAEECH